MRFLWAAWKRNAVITAFVAAILCLAIQPAAAQVGPVPPLPSVPAPSEAKKATTETSNTNKADESKAEAAKSSEKKNATPSGDKKSAEKKPDPVQQWLENVRGWSLPGFIAWIRNHGVSVVAILLIASAILWLANRLHKRLVRFLAGGRGTAVEQENRARTLVGVMHNALRTTVITIAFIMLLEEVGVSIGPLLGGVAVVGLAVAFGAQSLIKDYFTGFLVILEQQYMIGDVVKISGSNFSGLTGQVEQITLRVTVLRDMEGAVYFIPHGQITVVSNLTHEWSQAAFDVIVPCSEQVDRVRSVFFNLVAGMRDDAKYGPMILNDPEMLGVDSLGDATFTIKFTLKTLPLKRWEVKRELLRRIKDKFQELQIKVSVPA